MDHIIREPSLHTIWIIINNNKTLIMTNIIFLNKNQLLIIIITIITIIVIIIIIMILMHLLEQNQYHLTVRKMKIIIKKDFKNYKIYFLNLKTNFFLKVIFFFYYLKL